jgi:hypothetical protein
VALPMDAEGESVIDGKDKTRYLEGRDGDHLVTPFQCEACHICNILSRDPQPNLPSDIKMIKLLRRASLDAFWQSPRQLQEPFEKPGEDYGLPLHLGFEASCLPL